MRIATALPCTLLILVLLGGCAATPPPYGNFATEAPPTAGQTLANDAVRQLLTMYPPARTRFLLQQPMSDAFGTALVTQLRVRGYALQESTGVPPANAAFVTLPLRYLLDQVRDAALYRVTLLVGNQSLTRAYLTRNDTLVPAGAWARRE